MAIFSVMEHLVDRIRPHAKKIDTPLGTRTCETRWSLFRILAASTILAGAEGCSSQPSSSGERPDKTHVASDIALIISETIALTISEPIVLINPPAPEPGQPPIEPVELPVYRYSDEKKQNPELTPEQYYQKLVEKLTTPELIEAFFRQTWHYQDDEAPGIHHPDPSHGVLSVTADRWQTPLQSTQRDLIGDCEDRAFLAAAILKDQGKLAFPIKFGSHAVALWTEHDGQEWILRSQCTRGQYHGFGHTLAEAYKTWWNKYRKGSSTPHDPPPNSLELIRIVENSGTISLHPLQILQIKNLAGQIDQARKLLENGEAKACLDILYQLPLEVLKLPLLRELEDTAKAVFWMRERYSRLSEAAQKLPR